MNTARKIYIGGIVQGVGFRPFIYNFAKKYKLNGCIYNDSTGVYIEVEGDNTNIDDFIISIKDNAPPLSYPENLTQEAIQPKGHKNFIIEQSKREGNKFVLISSDISTCKDCIKELNDPNDKRFEYPFINCTNCGPRFTIIKDVPYDRPKTTMSNFKMCFECEHEYHNPNDRRFHAQPDSCSVCGPKLTIYDSSGNEIYTNDIIDKTVALLKEGYIIALKGLGGYHLACDALNNNTVKNLRERKLRIEKPFAIMIPDTDWLDEICTYNIIEKEFLGSIQNPIVLIKKKDNCPVTEDVAPNNKYLGVMLPYTPLHYLIMKKIMRPLVMTSGDISEEPIAYKDHDALKRLKGIADYFLIHNREIYIRCDDSVGTVINNKKVLLRRSRGFVPSPIKISLNTGRQILAVGGHLKNTFCFIKNDYAFLSHHIGDLENAVILRSFTEGIEHFKKLFDLQPEIIAYDMHPEYLSTKYAKNNNELIQVHVQHHHAHIVSCMTENNLNEEVIGVAFDGTGYGTDGNIWGGEFLISNLSSFERVAHFEYIPLPGGEAAIKEPWRTAFSYLKNVLPEELENTDLNFILYIKNNHGEKQKVLEQMIDKKINSPLTSAAGRLFDTVAALCCLRMKINYEAQAAIELQMIADHDEKRNYNFKISSNRKPWILSFEQTIKEIVNDLKSNVNTKTIAGKFHNTFAEVICKTSQQIRKEYKLNKVVLSGGVFQNSLLCEKTLKLLEENGFEVFMHSKLPPNDGGISLGQAVIALHTFNGRK